ncbi:Gamma-aminobutyric acid type B receptor subunit 1 (GABA-B receptor 1) (GABA-B-R1) (GABA-BR1) (GABABR1) (Gb1) [Durusdinium trenchii]|uniref:Gamma-aminobutyric acid type B receptor subunit 1 (GABA-B receptor 1) (GABA-B-R1) (GABA-BR1) (GABABR1) (Gb1) n=1 Tax=Durusdinium trenchii TaxID=1381693 RepID=A0ABP0K8Q1_9DINO
MSDAVQQQAYQQEAVLQNIQRNLVLIYVGGFDSLRVGLITSMGTFERNQVLLRDGNLNRRLAMSDVPQTDSFEGLQLLDAADAAWSALKPTIQSVSQGAAVDSSDLKGVVELADTTIEAAKSLDSFFSTTTRTTTMLALEVLAPLPMTGSWAAGTTFRLAARLAEGLINQDQLLLPGYRLQHVIFDDKCDESVGSDIVVSAMAAKDTYVAIGGMGCDRVCRPISSLATSLRLPFLSYECASPDFSDTLAYPALARMGTVTTPGILNTIKELKAKNDWKNLFVISGDPAFYQVQMETYTQEFTNMGFAVQTLSAYESRWTEIENQMAMVKGSTTGLERVIFVLGSETFFRKLVCASITQGLRLGVVWLSTGTWRGDWWKKTDLLTSAHRQWLREDVGGLELKQAFAAFKNAWDSYSPNVETTRQALFDLYVTDQKDELLYADGTERYHGIHGQYHPTYRKKLYDRGYYDIFFFDLNGDLIYSVFKETDYATNFKAVGSGPWADSGLGQAFRGGLQNPEPWAESFRGR